MYLIYFYIYSCIYYVFMYRFIIYLYMYLLCMYFYIMFVFNYLFIYVCRMCRSCARMTQTNLVILVVCACVKNHHCQVLKDKIMSTVRSRT